MAHKITGVLNYLGLLMVLDYGSTSGTYGMISLRYHIKDGFEENHIKIWKDS